MNAPTLVIVRHGEIAANVRGRWHGATDSPLTRRGRRQAARTARHLAGRFPQLAAIYTSPLARCRATATVIAARVGRPAMVDDELREYALGELEDTPFRVLHQELDFFERIRGDRDYAPPGGESMNAVATRMIRALRRIHDRHGDADHVAVVTHGAALAIAIATLMHGDPSRWHEYNQANCAVSELLLDPEPLLAAFNRTDHL